MGSSSTRGVLFSTYLCQICIHNFRIFHTEALGVATDRPWGVWCLGLTSCLLHIRPHFGNFKQQLVGNFDIAEKEYFRN